MGLSNGCYQTESSRSLCSSFFLLKRCFTLIYHVDIWQVSTQRSCGDTCRTSTWCNDSDRCSFKYAYIGVMNEPSFGNHLPSLIMTNQCNAVLQKSGLNLLALFIKVINLILPWYLIHVAWHRKGDKPLYHSIYIYLYTYHYMAQFSYTYL